jgi:hypothetical protein
MPTEWFGNMWSIAILFGLGRLRTVTGPIPSLSYEELQSAPAEGLSKLAEYLEIDPGAGDWLRRAVEIVRPPQPPAWRRLPENERIQLEIACRPGLKELNKQRMDEFYALEAPANAGRQRLRSKR